MRSREPGWRISSYYEPRCGHGSSLSRGMHALAPPGWARWILRPATSRRRRRPILRISADGSAGGVHIAALGGLWQAAVFGFGGLSLRAERSGPGSQSAAGLADAWFPRHWRGRLVRIKIDQEADEISANLVTGEPMPLVMRGQRHTLQPGTPFAPATGRRTCLAREFRDRQVFAGLRSRGRLGSGHASGHRPVVTASSVAMTLAENPSIEPAANARAAVRPKSTLGPIAPRR